MGHPYGNSTAFVGLVSQNTQIWGAPSLALLGGTNGTYPAAWAGLGAVEFRNVAWGQGASIISYAAEAHSASSAAAELRFSTTPSGATSATQRMVISSSGNIGIGTTTPSYKLSVNGQIGAKEVIVTNAGWADFVFKPGYRLRPLQEVAAYIDRHHRLPDIPSETEVQEKGISIGEMQAKLLAKIEELTLHMIEAEKENRALKKSIVRLETASGTGRK